MGLRLRLSFLILTSLLAFQRAYGDFQLVSVDFKSVTCFGESDGIIRIEVSGGDADYYYTYTGPNGSGSAWASGTVYEFTGVAPGPYNVAVWDSKMENVGSGGSITQPAVLTVNISPSPAGTCPGTNLQLYGNPSGGNDESDYFHQWTGSGAIYLGGSDNTENPLFNSDVEESYGLTYRVEDYKGCWAEESITIEVFEAISASFSSDDVTCFEEANGSVSLDWAHGGSGSYEYNVGGIGWEDQDFVFGGLAAGSYNVYVRDANYPDDCNVEIGIAVINQPDAVTASASVTSDFNGSDISCHIASDGEVTVVAGGGTGDFAFSVIEDPSNTTGAGDGVFTGLGAGTYNFRVTDDNDCSVLVGPVTLNAPDEVTASASVTSDFNGSDLSCHSASDGEITVTASGGTGDLAFVLIEDPSNTTGAATGVFSGLGEGTYNFTVTDDNGCSVGAGPVTLTAPDPVTASASVTRDFNGSDLSCHSASDGEVTVAASGGTGDLSFAVVEDPSNTTGASTGIFTGLGAGTYNFAVTDDNGCSVVVGPVTLTAPDEVTASASVTSNFNGSDISCHGVSDGEVTVAASGGTGDLSFAVVEDPSNITGASTGIFTGLQAGAYTFTVTDANGCSVGAGPVTLTAPDPLVINSVASENITCNGLSNGTLTVEAAGGTDDILYSINDGAGYIDNSGLFSNLGPGIYEISVRDLNGCETLWGSPVEISEPDPLFATLDYSDVSNCHGYTNGWIEIDYVEGSWAEDTGKYQYSIDGGASWHAGNRFEDLAAGTYNVQVRDEDNPGCLFIINADLVLTQPDPITGEFEFDPVSCYGGTDGRIKFINVAGGDQNYNYQYSIDGGTSHQINPEFKPLSHGIYDLSIRMSAAPPDHCPVTIKINFVLPEADELSASLISEDVTGCYGNANGSIIITGAAGGSGDFEFSADGGASWQAETDFPGLLAGTYDVYMRDANAFSCEMFVETVVIQEPEELEANFSVNDVSCHGGSDGSIDIFDAKGGSGNWEFSAGGSPWESAFNISGLTQGDHEVLMRDSDFHLCQVSLGMAEVNEPDPIVLTPVTVTSNRCFGDNQGSVEASASGGTPGYIYSLYDGAAFITSIEPVYPDPGVFSGLGPGTGYRVEVTDSRGCDPAVETDIVISEPAELVINSVDIDNIECHGEKAGIITINASGGSGQISYSINGSDFFPGNVFEDLYAGLYEVVVMDENGCVTPYGTVEVEQPEQLGGNISVTPVSCWGSNNGIIEITDPRGGKNGNYIYSVNGVDWQDEQLFDGLAPGSYSVLIGDFDVPTCFVELDDSPVEITEPEELLMSIVVKDVDCHGNSSGSITVNVTGGNGDFEYRLDDGSWQADNVFESLPAGEYLVQVRDVLGCSDSVTETVDEPGMLAFDDIDSVDETCFGASDGYIEIEVFGGTPGYLYSIDGGATFHENMIFTDLEPGNYNVAVMDAKGCTITYSSLLVLAASQIVIDNLDIADASCYGAPDGSIDVQAAGGSGTLEYSLDGVTYQSPGLFTGLPAGEYSLYVKDKKNCTEVFDLTVGQPLELQLNTVVLNTQCYGISEDPGIRATATGGSAPYTIKLYSGGAEQASFTNIADNETVLFESLMPGITDYEVVVQDDAGCSPVSSELLNTLIPDELVVNLISHTDLTCFEVNEGTIEVEASGGVAPYFFSLTDGEGNLIGEIESSGSASFENLAAGSYVAGVIDMNGCGPVETDVIVITQPQEIVIENFYFENITCFGQDDGSIYIIASGGTGELQYSINGGTDLYSSGNFDGLSPGLYEALVADSQGCSVSLGITEIQEPGELLFALVNVNNIIIGSQKDHGSVTIEMAGGTGPYLYRLDEDADWQADNHFDNLSLGVYDIYVIDDKGCTAETTFEIQEITGITASINTSDPSCHGYSNGMISIIAELGTEPYEYSIDGGDDFQSSGNFTELSAGTYNVVVKDAVGLTHSETLVLNDPAPIIATADITSATCRGLRLDGPDGEVKLEVSGGTENYSYLWSNGASTKDISGVGSGDYSVTITDGNYCEEAFNFTVGYENMVEVSLPQEIFACHGDSVVLNPSVQLYPAGSAVDYSWLASAGPDPGSVVSPMVLPSSPTYYSLRVADQNGCYDDAEVLVDQYPLQGVFIGNDTIVMHGSSIELSATTSGEFDNYQWAPSIGLSEISGPLTTAMVTGDIKYVVRAETEEGCREYDSIFIRVLMPIEPVSGFTPNDDGVNDLFDIPNAEDYPDIVVEVYNRAGQRVFHSRGYTSDKRWDGTFNGKPLPVGTYYFVITLNDDFGTRPVTGPVTIVR